MIPMELVSHHLRSISSREPEEQAELEPHRQRAWHLPCCPQLWRGCGSVSNRLRPRSETKKETVWKSSARSPLLSSLPELRSPKTHPDFHECASANLFSSDQQRIADPIPFP